MNSEEPNPTPAPHTLSGYQRICRALGGVKECGIDYVWDYHNETAVVKAQQTLEERKRSNRAKRIKML